MKIITTLFLTLILSLAALAQETGKWTKIASPKGDFSAQVAPNFLVDNENDAYRVYAFDNQTTMNVLIEESSDAKSRVRMMRQFSPAPEARASQFKIRDFIGNMYIYKKEKRFSISIYMALPKAFITVTAAAKEEKDAALEKFLFSIRLNNQALFKNAAAINQDTEEAISIVSLKTSPIVLTMLQTKDAGKIPVKYALENPKKPEEEDDDANYSRPLITLRKPRPLYTDKGRANDIQGKVRLKVLFKSNGQIGEVTVLRKLEEGLTEEAINAARKIKFVPAEIDGKPVDVTRNVEYTFTIY